MKPSILFLTCLTTILVTSLATEEPGDNSLLEAVREIRELIPYEKILLTVMRYVSTDPEVQSLVLCNASPASQTLLAGLLNGTEFRQLAELLQRSGLEVHANVDWSRYLPVLRELRLPSRPEESRGSGGLAGLAREVKAMVPFGKLEAMRRRKAETVPEYAALYGLTQSEEFSRLVRQIRSSETILKLEKNCRHAGFDIDVIINIICAINGLEVC